METTLPFPRAGQTMSPGRVRLCLAALVLYALAMGLPYLGAAPLASHEALIGMRTRSLMNEGGWVLPYTLYPSTDRYPLGQPDVRKPSLPFWIAGGLSALAGEVNEWTLRLPSVLAALGTMLLLVAWVRRAVGWRTALVTGLAAAASVMVMQWGRRAEVDMQLCFWTTLSLTAFYFGFDEPGRPRQVRWFLVMWVALGLAVLAKGPFPLAFWAIGGPLYALLSRQARRLKDILPLVGPLVMLAVAAPWVTLVMMRLAGEGMSPAEVLAAWQQQSVERYAGSFGHEKPFYYYLLEEPILWMPWLLPVVIGIFLAFRRAALSPRERMFLIVWGLGGLAVLSFGTGKRLYYALPVTPPFLVFAGLGLDYLVFGLPERLPKPARLLLVLHWFAVPAILAGAIVAVAHLPKYELPLALLGVLGACGLAAVLSLYRDGRRVAALLTFAAVMLAAVVLGTAAVAAPLVAESEEGAALGRAVAAQATQAGRATQAGDGEVAFYGATDDTVLFYARRNGPVFFKPEQVARWLAEHPRGLVVAEKGPPLEELLRLCRLEPVPVSQESATEADWPSVILTASPDPGWPPAPGVPSTESAQKESRP